MPEQLPAQTWLAARPNVYELLNRRVVPHGKQLYVLLHEAIDASTPSPQTVSELVNAVAAFLGRWSPEAADRIIVDTVLAKEHLSLMDSLVPAWGPTWFWSWRPSFYGAWPKCLSNASWPGNLPAPV